MGTKYSTNSASGYNATPPADDGTVSEANKGKWSTIKTKLGDPTKNLADTINSDLVTHFDNGPQAYTSNQTLGASNYNQLIQASGSGVTLTLSDAATLTAGWFCHLVNTDSSNSITIGRATGGDTINGSAANYTLQPGENAFVFVVAAANGFQLLSHRTKGLTYSGNNTFSGSVTMSSKPIWMAEGANVASASTADIWTTGDGNTVHITGTTTITSLGTAPQAGAWMLVIFDGALTLTHGANLNLPTAANITTAAGDAMLVYADTTTQLDVLFYQRASGKPIIALRDYQSFDASGTWTKPTGFPSDARCLIEAWGAGASGARDTANAGGGGGGGAYVSVWRALSDLGATETVTIGSGGAAVTSGTTNGNNGGNTTFGSLVTAYGGAGGRTGGNGGGGGGGAVSAGSTTSGGRVGGGNGGTSTLGTAGSDAEDIWGGAGGGTTGGTGGGSTNGGAGGFAYYGGGGGGGGCTSTNTVGSGGTSVAGGNGGGGAKSTNNATAGTQPGGGGGGSESGNSGAGADGRVRVTVFG